MTAWVSATSLSASDRVRTSTAHRGWITIAHLSFAALLGSPDFSSSPSISPGLIGKAESTRFDTIPSKPILHAAANTAARSRLDVLI
jgi:hypothetical protein